ncbi:MAG: glycolate oxidase subunit GlcE [Steroidobacteraceae bacterium]
MALQVRYTPVTAAEVELIVADAAAEKRGLEVCGGGSKRLLRRPITSTALLDMSALAGITDYDPDELVVTARAGTPLVEIETALAERQQMLAFEPFDHGPLLGAAPGRATLGGIVAANVSGSRRLSIGAARDHILGFTAVSGRGEALKGGGGVVKNVTGFDLPKLMAGSWGTLAVLTCITMRVLPRPRAETTVLFKGLSGEAANRLMGAALALPAAVAAAAHVPALETAAASRAVTALRLEGFAPSVEVRCRDLLRALEPLGAGEAIAGEESRAFWHGVRTLDALPRAGHVLWRISVPPARGWQVPSLLASDCVRYVYDWAGALVWAAVPENDPHAAGAQIRAIARSLGGHARLIRAPPAMRETLVPADAEQGLKSLQQRLKAAFDPQGILNPGLDLTAEA